ncbi:G-protein alpha subunit-domain-containing protein [Cerioporus squamosus]|nr:G-protein alpha subunit-domain-containing protein [Cerioporus squamosus]
MRPKFALPYFAVRISMSSTSLAPERGARLSKLNESLHSSPLWDCQNERTAHVRTRDTLPFCWRAALRPHRLNIKQLLEILQEEWELSLQMTTPSSIAKGKGVAGCTPSSPGVRFSTSPLNDNHRRIRMRLSALLPIEAELMRKLMPDGGAADRDHLPEKPPLVLVSAMKGAQSRPSTGDARFKDNPTAVLAACRDDIIMLWEDAIVQGVLKKQNARIQDMPGFFLNDAGQIAVMNYEPTDDDIVRARIRTLGVEEHHFTMEGGALPGMEWYIYDVSRSRSVRQHWIPFFDDVQAIIFLAPLAFNLVLEEDPKVNRLTLSYAIGEGAAGVGRQVRVKKGGQAAQEQWQTDRESARTQRDGCSADDVDQGAEATVDATATSACIPLSSQPPPSPLPRGDVVAMPLIGIQVCNFKSYRGPPIIGPFCKFTAVIGPNGTGKSNLMDGISLVLAVKSVHLQSSQQKDLVYRAAPDHPALIQRPRCASPTSSNNRADLGDTTQRRGDNVYTLSLTISTLCPRPATPHVPCIPPPPSPHVLDTLR